MINKRSIPVLLSLLFSWGLNAQNIDFIGVDDLEEYSKMLNIARSKNLSLVVCIYHPSDPFRQMKKDDVFDQPELEKAWSGLVPLSVDVRTSMGARWMDLFPARDLPAFYFLDTDEILYHTIKGYQPADKMLAATQKALELINAYLSLKEQYRQHQLDAKGWNTLLQIQALNFSFRETMGLALEFLNGRNDAQLFSKEALPILTLYGIDLETVYPQKIIDKRKAIASQMENFDFADYYERAYSYNLDLALDNGDTVLLDKIFEVLLPANPDTSLSIEELQYNTAVLFAEEIEVFSPWKKQALARAKKLQNDTLKAQYLFNEAFDITDEYNSPAAVRVAHQLAAKANVYYETFRCRMLESYTAYLLKEYETALQLVTKAAAVTDNPINLQKAENLKKMIEREMEEEE